MSSSASRTLGSLLGNLDAPARLPLALPAVHLSVARWFEAIAGDGVLSPRLCGVFNRDLLYLYYGGVFYRTGQRPTRNAAELPVAFLFAPSVLTRIDRYFPFDTGALANGRFGPWRERLDDFEERFGVEGAGDYRTPTRLVHHVYSTNEHYLKGTPDKACLTKPEPLPQLFEFLTDDLSANGVDKRQCAIECQTTAPVDLDAKLLWIGFPESHYGVFQKLYEHTKPVVPESFCYESHVVHNPTEVAAQLELRASAVVRRYVRL